MKRWSGAYGVCSWQQIPVAAEANLTQCRLPVTQRDGLESIAGRGVAAAKGGSVKNRHLGQICVGANTAGGFDGFEQMPPQNGAIRLRIRF